MPKTVVSVAAALLLAAALPAFASGDAIEVRVQIRGEEVTVDASLSVRATQREVWAVITDYDSAPQYVSDLEKSVTVSRKDNVLVVAQRASKGFGPFRINVESLKEIRLTPFEKTESRGLGGSMKNYAATTRLVPEGGGTRIVYRARSTPDIWLPPLIGEALVENETRARLEELRGEILRRKASGARNPDAPVGAAPAPRSEPGAGRSAAP